MLISLVFLSFYFFYFFILIFIILPFFFKDNEHESIASNTCEFRNGYSLLSSFKSNKDLDLKSLKSFKLLRISAKFPTNPSNPSIIKSASSSISKKLPHHCTPFHKPHYGVLLGSMPWVIFEM